LRTSDARGVSGSPSADHTQSDQALADRPTAGELFADHEVRPLDDQLADDQQGDHQRPEGHDDLFRLGPTAALHLVEIRLQQLAQRVAQRRGEHRITMADI
jgi:hypothetical protein